MIVVSEGIIKITVELGKKEIELLMKGKIVRQDVRSRSTSKIDESMLLEIYSCDHLDEDYEED